MIIIRLFDKKTFNQLEEFLCRIDDMPWQDIRVWQSFAHVTINVLHDA
jgi:hypothetical protein